MIFSDIGQLCYILFYVFTSTFHKIYKIILPNRTEKHNGILNITGKNGNIFDHYTKSIIHVQLPSRLIPLATAKTYVMPSIYHLQFCPQAVRAKACHTY